MKALDRAHHHAKEWLAGLDARSVASTVSSETLRARLDVGLQEEGVDAARIIDELAAHSEGGHLGSAGGRFFAWVIGGAHPSALGADWLTTAWDQNAGAHACAPATTIVEDIAGEWLKQLLDLPREASFAFTTGCQLAHFTGLAAARHAVLARAGWDVEAKGLFGAPPIRVLTSAHRHVTVDRAVRFLGLGTSSLVALPVDAEARVTKASLASALGDGPTIVVLDAADLNVAAFDPFADLIPLAKKAGAWVHIDGAFGLFARASRKHRGLLDGVELADSWATDGHKWLNVPFDCGVSFVRDREAHRAAMAMESAYVEASSARDPIDWTPEWSRRARGVSIYAALRELGRRGVESLVDRSCAHCERLVDGMGAIAGVEVVARPQLNQGLVRFLAEDGDHDRHTDAIIAKINATGEVFFSGTTWNGARAMRVSVVNFRTTSADVERAVAAVRSVCQVSRGSSQ